MRVLRFAGGLLAVVLAHVAAVRTIPGFTQGIDLFLLLVLFNAVGGSLAGGLLGGLAAGLVTDSMTGSLYGLHGTADSLIGYGAAFASQRVVIQRAASVMMLFSLAAAAQQGLLLGLRLLLLPDPATPQPAWLVLRIVAVGALGVVGFALRRQYRRAVAGWKRSRRARLR